MTTAVTTFAVAIRTGTGKGKARVVRRTGLIPAILYGDKHSPTPITIDPQLINAEMNKPGFFTRTFDLVLEGTRIRTICRDLQRHPVSHALLHADFQRIGADSLIHVAVPLHVINEAASPGVKRGGMVNLVEHTIEIVARPTTIPTALEIDVTSMKIGDSLHLSQVKLPEGVRLLHPDPDLTIATIVAPSSIETDESAAGGTTTL
ncbi:LSU ribosomal protein L25p [invertebrate metagenome]|uniref:LSU ribosomal protein L25p n=1 Tax=invertebrate metagenome TaxID=1711999 RepID=A0A484H726_9ZZZZ